MMVLPPRTGTKNQFIKIDSKFNSELCFKVGWTARLTGRSFRSAQFEDQAGYIKPFIANNVPTFN